MPVETLEPPLASPRTAAFGTGRLPCLLGGNDGPDAPLDGELRVESHSARSLPPDVAAEWDDLSVHAASPNVFYSRWNVEPALRHLTPELDVNFALVYRRSKNPHVPEQLCGLFPLVQGRGNRIALSVWKLWGHRYGYLQTPLIRAGHERAVLEAWFDWAAHQPRVPRILHWSLFDGEGPIEQALTELVDERRLVAVVAERRSRAILVRKDDWEQAAAARLSSHHRRELRRLNRRLSEQGRLSVLTPSPRADLSDWQHAFLRLEDSGWKGQAGTSLATDPQAREYFLEMTRAAHQAGQLLMLGLFLDGQPIAMRVGLQAGRAGFAWKIAYDERFAKFSPGVQLEIESVRALHEDTQLEWMDSCAATQHFMINRLWSDRRTVQHLLISTGSRIANLAVGAFPLARAIKRSLRRKPRDAASIES